MAAKVPFAISSLKLVLIGMSISHGIVGAISEVVLPSSTHTSYTLLHARHSLTMRFERKTSGAIKSIKQNEEKQRREKALNLTQKKNVEAIKRIDVEEKDKKLKNLIKGLR